MNAKVQVVSQKIDPTIAKEIVQVKRKTQDLPTRITSAAEFASVGATQNVVHALIKSIEAWYARHIDPINDTLKALRAEKKKILSEPEEWNDRAERLLSAYNLEQEEKAEKERIALQKKLDAEALAARKKEIAALKKTDKNAALELASAPVIAPLAEVQNAATLDGKTFKDELEVLLLDIDLVPVEYLKRELKINAVKAAYKNGVRDIPGVKVSEIKTLVNGG